MRLAYLFSRYPVISQTFIDTEMLALERLRVELEIYSVYPPHTSFRHGHSARLKAPIQYAPPPIVLRLGEEEAKQSGRWPAKLVAEHERKYGAAYKPALRARNALYFADLFQARGIRHFHVHFANRAAHTAIFIKAISGIPFSVTGHGQDYMVDLGSVELLQEIARESVFFANETVWSTGELRRLCPDSAGKMVQVYNGMEMANFASVSPGADNAIPRIVSIGRLIEFKGFHHLIASCALLRERGLAFSCEIIGEGPWRAQLEESIARHGLESCVQLLGALPQEEVFRHLKSADIFALPCIVDRNGASDVFPTVIMEAMASARPVVSTRLAGVPEQIVDGETGFICAPGDEKGFADALEKLLRSPDLCRRFGEAGRRKVQTELVVDTTVKALLAQYEAHIAPAPGPDPRNAGLAFLLDAWPASRRQHAELHQLAEVFPNFRACVFRGGDGSLSDWRTVLRHCDFLPDAMVLEGEWQQEPDLRHRLETWRAELGAMSTEEFLQDARRALYLRKRVQRDGVRHVHAAGVRELPTAWLLRRLCGVTISATIENHSALAGPTLLALARECIGVRVADRRLAASLAESGQPQVFRESAGSAYSAEWLSALEAWMVTRA